MTRYIISITMLALACLAYGIRTRFSDRNQRGSKRQSERLGFGRVQWGGLATHFGSASK